ncbi:TnsA-like heteromeric transposase endonuclease subunit [Arthrobacter crystallopoietes]|uniref:TnsA-like heteromeric transposase endonuclease subunit n=1 Tax=Crystallibacter crystallopoietes TaxID=37928 RepID=UPI0014865AF0|nr:TnsA-like heteromeric transposase endonuclease subunit [Arthrobacter crystallopoietes]
MHHDPYRHVLSQDRYLLLWQENGETKQKHVGPDIVSIGLEDTERVRVGRSYPHRRHYDGVYPVIETRQSVWYESMLELQCLMQLEHAGDLAGISTQPMCFVGPNRFRHYPDFFYRRSSDQTGVVVDVRARERMDEPTRARYGLTAALCRSIGWEYEVMHGLTDWAAMNLEWLSAFRHPRFALPVPAIEQLLSHITQPISFIEAAKLIDSRAPELAKAHLYHLMWRREVVTISDGPFCEEMLIIDAQVAP